jgi:hypothetical protein
MSEHEKFCLYEFREDIISVLLLNINMRSYAGAEKGGEGMA